MQPDAVAKAFHRQPLLFAAFTLVELIVVMAVFSVVVAISGYTFTVLSKTSGTQIRSAENQASGIVGLELLRWDIEHAGYGLPWEFAAPLNYNEFSLAANNPVDGVDGGDFNDSGSPGDVPRAMLSGNSTKELNGAAPATVGPAYLVIKSGVTNLDQVATRWNYVSYSYDGTTFSGPLHQWTAAEDNAQENDWGIVIRNSFSMDTGEHRQLVNGDGTSWLKVPGDFILDSSVAPRSETDVYLFYSLTADTALGSLRMPFNRSDYFIVRPANIPQSCAPNTGILYKGIVSQRDGTFERTIPILDCVADMQLLFDMVDEKGVLTQASALDPATYTAATIRNQIKMVRIYLLTHEGGIDRSFTYPSDTIMVGQGDGTGRAFKLSDLIGGDWQHYRWRVLVITATPKNLAFEDTK